MNKIVKGADKLEKMKLPHSAGLSFLSKTCDKHEIVAFGKKVVKPVQMMLIDGLEVCPRCEKERQDELLREEQQHFYDNAQRLIKHNTLLRDSLISDKTILNARFENYEVNQDEQRANKQKVMSLSEQYRIGNIFNIFIQGTTGAGKSHLAYSLLKSIHDSSETTSCLYIDIDEMIRKIKDSFNNKESKYTESYFVNLLTEVDFLVLDDLGAEVGSIDTTRQATDFIQRVLRAVLNARQDKCTITTSNLSSVQLKSIYDKKIISRLFKNPRYVVFQKTEDQRVKNVPF
ncbi:ATP-binding protein [Peribacillus frigoritolerans]|uniref:ATP-binding protein n=1 Tax=Peribacillus frigoritolerans TaxID=450367 RepID=UPI003ECC8E74